MTDGGLTNSLKNGSSRTLLENMIALYGVQAGRKLIPLVTIPYLARVLGTHSWGKVAFVAAAAELLVIVIEFGFNLSATREVARNRDSREACGAVMSGVLGAQFLLAVVGVSLAACIYKWVPMLRDNPDLVIGGLVYAIAQGISPVWFFQGLEKLRLASTLEVTGKVASLCGMFVFVRGPQDAWKWMALCGIAPALSAAVALYLAARSFPLRFPTPGMIRSALHTGLPMFVFRSAESLYGVGNSFLLGLFAPPELVGYFASAEKVTKAAYGLLLPIRDAIYPRLSHLAKGGLGAAAPLARIGTIVMVGGGVVVSAALFLLAPWIIHLLLGAAFEPAVAVMRILSVLPLLLSITNSAGMQWLMPFGRESSINRIIIAAGILNVLLSLVLAPRYEHIGMAWAVTASELFVAISMTVAVMKMLSPTASSAAVTGS